MDPINLGGKEERKLLEGSRAVGSPKQLPDSFPIRKATFHWLVTMKGFPPQQPIMGEGFLSFGTGC